MMLKERRAYLLLLLLVISLMLVTLLISRSRIQQLEETKPKLGMLISPLLSTCRLSYTIRPLKSY